MKMTSKRIGSARDARGSTAAELGPALLVLFLFIFFPALNLMSLVVSYGACLNLNNTQLREAAFLSKATAQDSGGPVRREIPELWTNSGIGRFVSPVSKPETAVTYYKPAGLEDDMVVVTTRVTVRPVFVVPFFSAIPGLGAAFTYEISGQRLLENSVAQG